MANISKKKQLILDYIEKNQPVKPGVILDTIEIGEPMLYRHLKALLEKGSIEKIGSSPRTFYRIALQENERDTAITFSENISDTLENHFYDITASGKILEGASGFVHWCEVRGFEPKNKAKEFFKIHEKYQKTRKGDLLNATSKLKKTFGDSVGADALYYYDFYSIEIFGKTKMGQKLLYAKQSEDKNLMREIAEIIKPALDNLIQRKNIDAIAYVQPTVPRQTQFMKVLENELNIALPKITIVKVLKDIRVPQKTLKKLADRIENANETFVVESSHQFKRVLLIDDAVGSGASINQIAHKIKGKGFAQEVIGFAVTGSLNDFDVISEV